MVNFLDGVEEEGQKLDTDAKEDDTSSDSSTEETEVKDAPAEEDKETEISFDKDKTAERFKILTQHNQELKAELEEIRAWKEQLEADRENETEETAIPEWFYGDENAWKKYQEDWKNREQTLQEKIIETMYEQKLAQSKQEESQKQHWENWVDEQLDTLEESKGKFDRNKLMAIVEKYKPTDLEGNLDFNAGFELMRDMDAKVSTTTAKKSIADTSNSSKTVSGESYEGMIKQF